MQRAEKRERERLGQPWVPKFFNSINKVRGGGIRATHDPLSASDLLRCFPPQPALFEGELEAEKVPFWEWNGSYSKLPERGPAKEGEVDGKSFCPWQFPSIHESLDREDTKLV